MNRQRVIDYTVYVVVRILIAAVQATSIETGAKIAHFLAWLFAHVLKIRRRVVEENLTHAFPEMSQAEQKRLIEEMWEHLFLLVLEVAHTPRKIHDTNWRDYVELQNDDLLVQHLLSENPLMIVTGHLGNFEVGGYVLGILGFPTYTVARTLDNPYLDRFVNDFRGRTGQYIITKDSGSEPIEKVLAAHGTMTFLADQYAGPKGCWIDFFGRQASAYKALALLSLGYNGVMAVSAAMRKDRPMHFLLHNYAMFDPRTGIAEKKSHIPSIDPEWTAQLSSVKEITQWYNSRLEDLIRLNPSQYWWIHRRWKDTREPKQKLRRAA